MWRLTIAPHNGDHPPRIYDVVTIFGHIRATHLELIILTEATLTIRVALVGGLPLYHDATRALLDREGFELAVNGSADVVLVDQDDAPSIREVRAQYGDARVLVVTARTDHESSAQLVRDGAHGIVSKARTGEHLVTAIRKVHAGEMWVDRVVATTLIADLQRPGRKVDADRARNATLTARERDVVNLVGEGLANKAIAERLSISDNTVRHHLTSIFAKLGVTDRLSLVVYAYRQKLI
jgi:DNA-binding NarL/FixJ family response regulator